MSDEEPEKQLVSRRGILTAATAIAGVGASGYFTGLAAASDGSASGQIATAASPALHVYLDTLAFHERTSDPSSPANGTMWYNSSA